jgi:hypothetical protein
MSEAPLPQRLGPYRSGKRLVLSRWYGWPGGDTNRLFWTAVPCALLRSGYEAVSLRVAHESHLDSAFPSLRNAAWYAAPDRRRIAGMAASPAADGIVARCEDPAGFRLTTVRDADVVATRVYADPPGDSAIATDGRRILVQRHHTSIEVFDDWTLARSRPWSLAPLQAALGPVDLNLCDLRSDGDAVAIATADSWSRWTWDGRLIEAWRSPELVVSSWCLVGPLRRQVILHMRFDPARIEPPPAGISAARQWHLVKWDLATGRGRSLGDCYEWPKGDVSRDGRWLAVDRVLPEGRGFELWDLDGDTLVERIPIRKRGIRAAAFSPDAREVAVATTDDLFVMRLDV